MAHIASLLLDRDGTLIKDKHYLADPEGVELLHGVGEALAALAGRGLRFFLVSNQSGIGRGMFSEAAAHACNQRLAALLGAYGVSFTDMLFCPHAPEDNCLCRKPGTGMWHTLVQRHGLAPETCLMIGDKEEDMLFAARAGLAGRALVLTGKGSAAAARLGLAQVDKPLVPSLPDRPEALPDLLLPGFNCLEQGLALLSGTKEPA